MKNQYGPSTVAADSLHAMKYRGPGEDFRESMNRIAFGLKDSDVHYHELREILLHQRFLPAGRVQSAIGALRQTTALNCFVSATIADSFVEGPNSIMDVAKQAAATMRMGGGIGYDFSTLRPRGEMIGKLQSHASGPVSFMRIFNEVCLATSSSGHRRGAQMGILRIDHPDVEEFIRAKQNTNQLNGFNVSLGITDEFMEAALTGQEFTLRWRDRAYRTVDAAALWETIMRSTFDYGEPGAFFLDTVNRMNNLYYCETITATNPCLAGETLIAVAGRGAVSIKQLAEEGKDVPVFAVDPSTGEKVVRWGRNPRLTQRRAQLVRVVLDDGSSIRCTPEHKFPLRNGVKVAAKDLKVGDSLFRFDSVIQKRDGVMIDGRPEYHLIAEAKYKRKFKFGRRRGEYHAHHVDENHWNNDWNNIEVKLAENHSSDHRSGDGNPMRFWWGGLSESEKTLYRTNMSVAASGENNGMWGRKHSPDTLKKIGEKTTARLATVDARRQHGEAVSRSMTPEVRIKISKSRKNLSTSLQKTCEYLACGNSFTVNVAHLNSYSAKRRFCSRSCAISHSNVQRRGRPIPHAVKEKISKSQLGRVHSKEHNEKVSAALLGVPKSASHRKAISEARLRATNHKVVSVEVDGFADVYNLTVDEFHNYAVITTETLAKKKKNPRNSGIFLLNCGEQPLPPHGACLLGSFNLVKYLKPTGHRRLVDVTSAEAHTVVGQPAYDFDFEQLELDLPVVVRGMDNVTDRTRYPLAEQRAEATTKRRMGLGVTGLANAAEALGHPYGSPGFLDFEAKVLTVIRDGAYGASAVLAAEKGPFPLFDAERYLASEFIQTLPEYVRAVIAKHGIRNSHLTSIAPTGTISLCADNVSSGLEPVFARELKRTINTPDGSQEVSVHDYGEAVLGVRGRVSAEVTAAEHVAVLTTAQRYVDSAVSKTVNMTGAMPWADFKAIYETAWRGGAKGCSTFNSDGKRGALLVATQKKGDEEGAACFVDPATGTRSCE